MTTARSLRYRPLRRIVHLGLLMMLAMPAFAAPRRPLIWAFGDSLTAGYGLPPDQGFTAQLERALHSSGIDAEVRNGGVSGDTSAQGRARLLWGLRGLGRAPDLVIVELGANDMLRGLPPAVMADNLDRILTLLRQRGLPVLFTGMRSAPNMGIAYRRAYERVFLDLAKRHRVPIYPFFLEGVAGDRGLIQADGLHPNARGVTIIVGKILPAVRAALKRTGR